MKSECLRLVIISALVIGNCNNTSRVIKFLALLIYGVHAVYNCMCTRGAFDIFVLLRRVARFSRKCIKVAFCMLINVGKFGTKFLWHSL